MDNQHQGAEEMYMCAVTLRFARLRIGPGRSRSRGRMCRRAAHKPASRISMSQLERKRKDGGLRVTAAAPYESKLIRGNGPSCELEGLLASLDFGVLPLD